VAKVSTEHGYDFFEVTSAMQKGIRRGQEEEALYWAFELSYRTPDYVWKRLSIIASEDIGPADNHMAVLIHDLSDHYREEAKRSQRPTERIFLAHAIIALCRAQKSRIADDLMCVVTHQLESEGLRREIPDVALDRHTQRGRRQGRGWDHWVEEGCRVIPETVGMNVYKERATAARKQYGPIQAKQCGRPNLQGSLLPEEEEG
jgi:replication-associated recombination protein RarA